MSWNASELEGYAVHASDGLIGVVKDFLFDDTNWTIRWLVVDTHRWLLGRRVLLPPSAFGHPDTGSRQFLVNLTQNQVKESPESNTDEPVSRQMESGLYSHFGFEPYWEGPYMLSGAMTLPIVPPNYLADVASVREPAARVDAAPGNPHLRSIEAVTGYHIKATDGPIGHAEDFLIDEASWSIASIVVDTKNLLPGRRVQVLPRWVSEIDWADNLLNLNVDRKRVQAGATPDDLATPSAASHA